MSDLISSAAPPYPTAAEKLKFYALWVAAAIALLLLPKFFGSGGSLTTFSLIGISIIFSLSYNMLLGQTGMLSFGHAVYYGLGGFLVIHAINIIGVNKLPIPLPVVPLIGGLTGLLFAVLLGWVSTQRSGTAFAMISLGVAELIASSALILRTFFGGEAGISANRTKLLRVFGWSFGPQIQIYYLVAAWTLIAVIAMYGLTRTPLGRMCNAVRDNPERVQFVGYDPHVVRYLAFCFSGFFAGIAGALAAINFEIANSAYLGAVQSGTVLFATYIGGVGRHHRPLDDASPAAEGWHPHQGSAQLPDRLGADPGNAGGPHPGDRNHRSLHRQPRRRFPYQGIWRLLRRGESVHLGDGGDPADRRLCGGAQNLDLGRACLG